VLSDTSADKANADKGWDNETHIEQDPQGNTFRRMSRWAFLRRVDLKSRLKKEMISLFPQ
jgi:hypothetical protein